MAGESIRCASRSVATVARLRHHGHVLIAAATLLILLVWVSSHSNDNVHAEGFRRLIIGTETVNQTVDIPCDVGAVQIPFQKIYSNVVCAKYADSVVATSASECALACSSQPGCSTFSYEDSPTGQGCRISACKSEVGSGAYCGKSFDVTTPSIEHQCYTMPSERGALFSIQSFYVSSAMSRCGSQYVQYGASSPTCCAVACQAREGCKSFSFSDSDGCRLSACGDGLAFGGTEVCGANRQCNNQSMPGFYMYTLLADMKVVRETIINGKTITSNVPIQTITLAPITALPPVLPPTPAPASEAPAALAKPVVWKGSFIAKIGEIVQMTALSSRISQAASASLANMFPVCELDANARVHRYNASAFSCTFQFGTDSVFFDKDEFYALLHSELGTSADSLSIEDLQAARTNTPCAIHREKPEKSPFERLAKSAVCSAHYRIVQNVTTPEACSLACAGQPGCVVFSFGSVSSCRISLFRRQYGKQRDVSEVGGATLHGQCATRPAKGSNVFNLIALQVVSANAGCKYRYVPHPASDPGHCWQACRLKRDCKAFSFGVDFGCRLSACTDPRALGTSVTCSPEHDSLGGVGACVAEAQDESYLYALTSKPKGTFSGALPAGGSEGGGAPLIKVFCAILLVGGVLLVAFVLKKLKDDGRMKEYMRVCQDVPDICPTQTPREDASTSNGLKIKFSTEDGPKVFAFFDLPLSIAFWDELPLRICQVKENSEAQKFGLRRGWIATHVNGKLVEGADASECVLMINKMALDLEASGRLQRVTTDTGS